MLHTLANVKKSMTIFPATAIITYTICFVDIKFEKAFTEENPKNTTTLIIEKINGKLIKFEIIRYFKASKYS